MRLKYIDSDISCTNSGKLNANSFFRREPLHANFSFYRNGKFILESYVEKHRSWNGYNEQSW